jgi:hypothetical protein
MKRLLQSLVALGLLAIVGVAGSVFAQSTPDTGTPPADSESTTSATLRPGEITAGQIADRIAAAWPAVTSYRIVTTVVSSDGTPSPSPVAELPAASEQEVVLPDTKRLVVREGGITTEIVLAGGVLSKRVTSADGTLGPWETIDPAAVDENDPFALTYETILAPAQPPYSGLSDRQRDRIGTMVGVTEINGRTCTGYLFPEVTETGERFEVFIFLDESDLLCRIETHTLSVSQADFYFNEPITIATPAA